MSCSGGDQRSGGLRHSQTPKHLLALSGSQALSALTLASVALNSHAQAQWPTLGGSTHISPQQGAFAEQEETNDPRKF